MPGSTLSVLIAIIAASEHESVSRLLHLAHHHRGEDRLFETVTLLAEVASTRHTVALDLRRRQHSEGRNRESAPRRPCVGWPPTPRKQSLGSDSRRRCAGSRPAKARGVEAQIIETAGEGLGIRLFDADPEFARRWSWTGELIVNDLGFGRHAIHVQT